MAKLKKPFFFAWILIANIFFLLGYIHLISKSTLFVSLRLKTLDSYLSWRSQKAPTLPHFDDVVVVGIDDESFRKLNLSWPWGRDVFAIFLESLSRYQPKAVALDFTFIGKSPNSRHDEQLAKAMKLCREVIIGAYFDADGVFVRPLDLFSLSAKVGFLDTPLDRDGVVRRVKEIIELENGKPVYSFAAEAVYAFLGLPIGDHIRLSDENLQVKVPRSHPSVPGSNQLNTYEVQKDGRNQVWLSYRYPPQSLSYVSFWRVIARRVAPRLLKDKLVLVGVTSPLFHDIQLTPYGRIPGIFVNATDVLTLLDADFFRDLTASPWWFVWQFIVVVGLTYFFYRSGTVANFIVLMIAEVLLYAVAVLLFYRFNWIVDGFTLMFLPIMVFLITFLFRSSSSILENLKLQRLVVTDYLTGLYVLRYLSLRLKMEWDRAQDQGKEFCLSMIDIDHFKNINDHYGHEKGNEVLVAVAKTLKSNVRGLDAVARYGGDEFAIIFVNESEKDAIVTMEKIHAAVCALSFDSSDGRFSITLSSGICSNRNSLVKDSEGMITIADKALYDAKAKGRNRVSVYH